MVGVIVGADWPLDVLNRNLTVRSVAAAIHRT